MSSATSIEGAPAKPAAVDAGFRPWHFFVLASLMAATVAVLMSRRSTPEHLILISLAIGAAGLAAAGFYRMLAPLVSDEASTSVTSLSDRVRGALEREKALTLRSIKELEFDRAMGKVSPKDFDEMAGRLRARAMALIRELDQGPTTYRAEIERELNQRLSQKKAEPAAPAHPVCDACGAANDLDAAFCKKCGTRLVATAGGAA
jgi:ribosomal protein L40E